MCLRISDTLKEDMSSICNSYNINHADFIRRAIADSITTHAEKSGISVDGKFEYVWWVINHWINESAYRMTAIYCV